MVAEFKRQKLIALADAAISAAQSELSQAKRNDVPWLIEECERAIRNFTSIREQARSGTLSVSGGAGLGITRALSEWGASDALYGAGVALEDFYREQYNA